jgi:ParB/RepB/Spo0J family partition protein
VAPSKSQRLARAADRIQASVAPSRKAAAALPARPAFGADAAKLFGTTADPNSRRIPVGRIEPDPDQPRREFDVDELARLAESLKDRGQLQPIRVRWEKSRRVYVVVAGERRWRAAKLAGLAELLCVEATGEPSAEELLVDQLVENCCRKDLAPIEEARAFRALAERAGWSAREIGRRLGVSHDRITRSLALLKLPEEVLDLVDLGDLAPAVALECGKAEDPGRILDLARAAAGEGLSRDDVRHLRNHEAIGIDPDSLDVVTEVERPAPPVTHRASPAAEGAPRPVRKSVNVPEGHEVAPPAAPAIAAGEGPGKARGEARPKRVDILPGPPPAWEVAVYLDGLEHRVSVTGPGAVGDGIARAIRLALDLVPRS